MGLRTDVCRNPVTALGWSGRGTGVLASQHMAWHLQVGKFPFGRGLLLCAIVQNCAELSRETIDICRLCSRIGQESHATGGNLVDSSHQLGAAFFERTRPFRRVL